MTIGLCRFAFAVLLTACAGGRASAAVTYTSIAHPLAGAGGTFAYDIDGPRIVGTYLDAAGASHAFVYEDSTWTTLDHPNAAAPRGTSAYGVSGDSVVGTFVDATGRSFGYQYDGATWTTLAHPPVGSGPIDTFARGVSGSTVVGYYIESLTTRGFVYDAAGGFRDIVIPGATDTSPDDVDGGRIVGTFDNATGTHAFLLDGALIRTIDHPLGTVLGTYGTGVGGTNVVGNYLSLIDGSAHGFLYDGSRFTAIDFPGATDTTVNGIDGDRIVGSYVDPSGAIRGFIAVIPEPAALALAAPWLLLAARRPRRRLPPG